MTSVSGSGPYSVTTSQSIPSGTDVTFAGGPGGVWLGTASPSGADQIVLTLTAGSAPQAGDVIVGGSLTPPCTLTAATVSAYVLTTAQPVPFGSDVTFTGGSIARLDGSGDIVGIDPARTPPEVGAKLTYDPASGTLAYAGAMSNTEQADLLSLSTDPAWEPAIASLYTQPATFLADNLGSLLKDPNAPNLLLYNTASLDGSLNPVLVDADGNAEPDPALAVSTAIAWKFAYLLGKLLPYLQNTLSHTLVRQTIADEFGLDPTLTSLLLEQVLTAPGATPASPGAPVPAVIDDLLALGTPGATATYHASSDLSGEPSAAPTTIPAPPAATFEVSVPTGNQSASFTAWLEVPSSTTYTFSVNTNGTPQLYVGDPSTPVALEPDPTTAGLYTYSVALSAGGFTYIGLQITGLPPSQTSTATLSWQSPATQEVSGGQAAQSPQGGSIANAPLPSSALLPDAIYQTYSSAYVRIQKAALVCNGFALTAPEIQYLTTAGSLTTAPDTSPPVAFPLFAGFNLNALPYDAGNTSAAEATALFAVWQRLYAYSALRNSLPNGSVSLIDLFNSPSFNAATTLLPQVTGWPDEVCATLLTQFCPGSTPTSANPLLDEILLAAMQACANLIQQVGASAEQLFSWAEYAWTNTPPSTPEEATYAGLLAIATDIQNATAANYDAESWPAVAEQLNNTLRASQRNALVSYLMGQLGYTDPDSLFDLLLIDPEMGTCMQTSRIRQALNSVQLFVQRCLLSLETAANSPGAVLKPSTVSAEDWGKAINVAPSQIDATTWEQWMGAYATWAGTREIFLWPENLLIPSLRDDQTEIFEAFASSLQQGTITNDSVAESFLAYLQSLDQIDRLDIRAVYWQKPDNSVQGSVGVLHVFARTWHDPRVYFYRQLVGNPGAAQTWTPWQQVSLDIEGDIVVPAIWEGQLRLIWPVFTSQSYTPPQPSTLTATADAGGNLTSPTGPTPQNYWQVGLAWSEYYQGAWQPKNVSDDFLISYFSATGSGLTLTHVAGDKPRVGDTIIGPGVAQPCQVTSVSGNGPYTIGTSQILPAGSKVPFGGGSAGVWAGWFDPNGSDTEFEALPGSGLPNAGDNAVAENLTFDAHGNMKTTSVVSPCTVASVDTKIGSTPLGPGWCVLKVEPPYDPKDNILLAGGPGRAWVGWASPPRSAI